jgi:PAS domain S-box-containing protein
MLGLILSAIADMNSIIHEEESQGAGLEVVPFPCIEINAQGVLVEANRLAHALLPVQAAFVQNIHPEDIVGLLAAFQSVTHAFEMDCRITHAHDMYRWFMLHAQPSGSAAWRCTLIDIHARKTREMRLSDELRIRNDMLNASIDCIKVISPDGLLTHMNRTGCAALGVAEDSPFGMTWADLLPDAIRTRAREAVEIARHGRMARFDGSSQLPGETPRYWDNVLTPVTDDEGGVTGMLCMSRDVTLQREAEMRLELAVRATDDAIWDWDLHRDRMCWNEAIERCYGYALASRGTSASWWFARMHPDDVDRVRERFDAIIGATESKYMLEYRFRRADGRYVDVCDRGYLSRDPQGKAVRIVGTMMDQTDRKAIERNLQQLNRTLEARANERTKELERLWKTSPDVLLVLSDDGIIRRASPAVSEALGHEPESVIGHHIHEYVMDEDIAALDRALFSVRGESHPAVEIRHRHRDGSCRWIAWAAASSDAELYATGRDVSAARAVQASLRKTEAALHQAQKLEAVGRLTGNVAHDFNNLLHVIQSSVELLRRSDIDAHKQARCIDAIADTAERGARLTGQLLAYGRRSMLTPVRFDVGANIRALREMIGTLVGPRIVIDIVEEEACSVHADSNQFDTAIVNIAVNACDAMNRQGRLRIHIRETSHMRALGGRFVAVSVEDQGTGIPEEKIDAIFEPFFTTKPPGEGTGLGLSQVFGFVKQSGGDILVESEVGVGSTFTLYLPLSERE